MERLNSLDLQIDSEVSLMDGITAAEGWTIVKVEIETIGIRSEIPSPYLYTPTAAGSVTVIITITDGTRTAEFCSDSLDVRPLVYSAAKPKAAKIYPNFNTANVKNYKE